MSHREQTRALLLLTSARDLLKRLDALPADSKERAEMADAIDRFLRYDLRFVKKAA